MERIFGYGSDKKIVHLDYSDTIIYLKTQIVDFKHDAGETYHLPNINIVNMMSKWLYVNNTILQDVSYEEFRANLIKSLGRLPTKIEDMPGLIGTKFSNLFRNNGFYARDVNQIADNNIRVIIDQCGPAGGAICNDKGEYALLTPSVVYDQGAHPQLCGTQVPILYSSHSYRYQNGVLDHRKHSDGSWRVPRFPTNRFNNYSDSGAVIEMARTITSYTCEKTPSVEGEKFVPLDYYIKGQLIDGSGMLVDVVLAYRGTIRTNVDGWEYLSFSNRITQDIVQNRGYSPTNNMLRPLHDVLPSICASENDLDMLVAYGELMAKHWGDLGLIIDAVNTNHYVISPDRTVKYLCAIFKANCIFDNRAYTLKDTVLGPYVYYETNTASLFS